MGAGAVGNVSEDLLPVLELNPVHAVGERLDDDPLHEWGALGHERRLYQTAENPLTLPACLMRPARARRLKGRGSP